MQKKISLFAATVCALLASVPASAQQAADPKWTIAPYLWGPSISLDTSSSEGGGISASELLDKTDSVGMLHLEWAPSRFGVILDYMFLDLSDAEKRQLLPPPAPGTFINASVDLEVLEVGGFFRQDGDANNGFDWLFGVRNISVDQTVTLTPDTSNPVTQRIDSNTSYTDVYGGARVMWLMGQSWPLSLRADISGGDTDGTTNFVASLSYMFPIRYHIGATLGYRYTKLKLKDTSGGETVNSEMTLSGPLLGFVFRF